MSDARTSRAGAYENPRPDVQALVPATARRILDVGCSSGVLGAALKARDPAISVTGIEIDPGYAKDAEQRLDRVICADVDTAAARDDLGTFDTIICADVLEHLVDPDRALRALVAHAEPGAHVVVSLPNVRYWEVFWQLGRHGTWPRRPAGLFDRTHLRWFTYYDARLLLEGAGLEVGSVTRRMLKPDGFPYPPAVERVAERIPGLRTFLSLQHILVGRVR